MNNLDLAHAVSTTFAPELCERMSARVGLAQNVIRSVAERGAAAITAGLVARCLTPQGAESAFAAVVSAAANPRIAEQLGALVTDTASFKDLEASGDALSEQATQRRVAAYSDLISQQTGVPPQATHVLTASAGAVLFGLLKHRLLIDQATAADLSKLAHGQLPSIEAGMTDALAHLLGFESVEHFVKAIKQSAESAEAAAAPAPVALPTTYGLPKLAAGTTVSANIVSASIRASDIGAARPAMTTSGTARSYAQKVGSQPAPSSGEPAAQSQAAAMAQAPISDLRRSAPRRSRAGRKLVWILALIAAGVATVFAYEQTHSSASKTTLWPPSDPRADGKAGPSSPSSEVLPRTAAHGDPASAAPTAASPSSASQSATTSGASGVNLATAAEESAPAAATNAAMAFRVDAAGFTRIVATVSNEAQRQALYDRLKAKLGVNRFQADVTIAPTARTDWLDHLDDLSELMTVRDAELNLHATAIELAGSAADQQRGWSERLQRAFGAPWRVEAFDQAARVEESTQAFRRVLVAAIDRGHPCAPADVANVLNAQIIDFARSSGHVPATARENLNEAALLLKTCANVGHPVKVEIAAFTDSMGDAQALQQLSQKRADSVRVQFIEAGVPAALLTAKGYGATRPVASDLTEIGRFANRRIEFSVQG
ncbi:ompA family protein [Burkholderia sp. MSHR3999]|uniref:OmpA family protein n=1 Tax=Burkholderia sp. MSHR3999 TaxID=1542965 RepID=UPI0005B72CBA|nr:OmpA family protein [Burkholderia sp. MSHR3999]KIP17305.1 ompA family protein [Burkholderia sp. MSHR3999]